MKVKAEIMASRTNDWEDNYNPGKGVIVEIARADEDYLDGGLCNIRVGRNGPTALLWADDIRKALKKIEAE
jgi:hypothetical protein